MEKLIEQQKRYLHRYLSIYQESKSEVMKDAILKAKREIKWYQNLIDKVKSQKSKKIDFLEGMPNF